MIIIIITHKSYSCYVRLFVSIANFFLFIFTQSVSLLKLNCILKFFNSLF